MNGFWRNFLEGLGMAQGPMILILVTIRVTVRIQESEVRNPDSLDYRLCWRSADIWALWALRVCSCRLDIHFRRLISEVASSADHHQTLPRVWRWSIRFIKFGRKFWASLKNFDGPKNVKISARFQTISRRLDHEYLRNATVYRQAVITPGHVYTYLHVITSAEGGYVPSF